MIIRKYFSKVIFIFMSVLFILLLLINDFRMPLEFDSSYNQNLIKNVAASGIYATSVYLNDGQKYAWFDPWITTGPSVLLPIALMTKLFNSQILAPRIFMNLCFILFIIVLSFLLKRYFKKANPFLLMATIIALILIYSKFSNNFLLLGINTLGELPAYLLILISCWGFVKDMPILIGLALALAVLSKLQIIFLALPLILGYTFYYWNISKNKIALKVIYSFCIPFFLNSLALLLVFGKNIRAYYGDFKGVLIMQNAYPHLSNWFYGIFERITLWSKFAPLFFILSICFVVNLFFCWKKIGVKLRVIFLAFIFYIFYYLAIWQFVSIRHLIIPEFILITLVVLYLMFHRFLKIINIFFVIMLLFSLIITPSLVNSGKEFKKQNSIARFLTQFYPSSTFYYIGWWKSPELGILLNKDFIRIDTNNRLFCKQNCQLIVSDYQRKLDPASIKGLHKYGRGIYKEGYTIFNLD